jgi:hypothetical protein
MTDIPGEIPSAHPRTRSKARFPGLISLPPPLCPVAAGILPAIEPGMLRALDFGHSDSLNPKGCQRVAGGRRSFMARRPPGKGSGEVNHPGWGDRAFEPARSGRTGRRRLWHPSRVLVQPTRLSGGRSGTRRNDHRLPSGNPPGWLPFQSTECPNFSGWQDATLYGRQGCLPLPFQYADTAAHRFQLQ